MTRETYATSTRGASDVERTITRSGGIVRLEVRRAGRLLASYAFRGDELAHLEVAIAIATCGHPTFARVATLARPRGAVVEILADSTPRVLVGRFERGGLVHGYDLLAADLEALARAVADARGES